MKSFLLPPLTVIVFFSPLLIMIGCNGDSERILTQAPQFEEDLGFIVAGSTLEKKEAFFKSNKSVKIRDISDEHIVMFEAVNTDMDTLRTYFPEARIYRNEFIYYADAGLKNHSLESLSQIKTLSSSPNPTNTVLNTTSTATFDFNSCKDQSLKPIAKMTPMSSNLMTLETLEVDAKIKIESSQSQPHAFVGGSIKKAWIIEGPLGTNVPNVVFADTLETTLDTMGVYQIFLLIQDQKSNCQFESVNLSVTGNSPYKFAKPTDLNASIRNQEYIQKLGLDKAHQTTKGEGVLIAIVDSGVNYNHPYLSENIFINTNEIPDNDIDDDNNGFVDDVHGWDFVFNDKYPNDDLHHGTHVAGLAAAKVFGVAPNAKILPIKAGNNFGMLDLGTTFKGIIYALKMKADIINLSLGSERPVFREELELYQLALRKDTLISVAAGNGEPARGGVFLGVDIDNRSFAPAGIDIENILTVAALNTKDNLAYYSNFGARKTNVATYGGEDFDLNLGQRYDGQLFSTYIENAQGLLFFPAHGTSMAAPVASGIAALVRSANPNLSAGQSKTLLENSGRPSTSLNQRIKSGRVLTADTAVQNAIQSLRSLAIN